jgi:hypothetical protein
MSDVTLTALLDLAEQHARLIVLKLKRSLLPSWVIVSRNGTATVLSTPWRSDLEKALAQDFLRERMKRLDAVSYSMVSEAWSAVVDGESLPDVPARKMPNRQEIVIALACDGTRTEYRRWKIKRDWNERVIALEPAIGNYVDLTSWTSLLDKGTAQK